MTLGELNKICKEHNIPEDVVLKSDSGWECCETPMNGIYYNAELNTLIFTPETYEHAYYGKGWDATAIPKGVKFDRVSAMVDYVD